MTPRLLLVASLLAACAAQGAADPAKPASAPPTPDADDRSMARPGVPPPRFKPSSSSPSALPITSNAYGAYPGAPDAPQLGDIAEDFDLPLIDGGTFSLAEARAAGPVLIMFYRGFW